MAIFIPIIFLTQAKAPRPPKVGAGEAAHVSSFSPKGSVSWIFIGLNSVKSGVGKCPILGILDIT